MELGYSFTSSVEECRSNLISLGADKREMTARCVAKVLAYMARTCSGLEDAGGLHSFWESSSSNQDNKEKSAETPTTWNVEVFVQAVKEVVCILFD